MNPKKNYARGWSRCLVRLVICDISIFLMFYCFILYIFFMFYCFIFYIIFYSPGEPRNLPLWSCQLRKILVFMFLFNFFLCRCEVPNFLFLCFVIVWFFIFYLPGEPSNLPLRSCQLGVSQTLLARLGWSEKGSPFILSFQHQSHHITFSLSQSTYR